MNPYTQHMDLAEIGEPSAVKPEAITTPKLIAVSVASGLLTFAAIEIARRAFGGHRGR